MKQNKNTFSLKNIILLLVFFIVSSIFYNKVFGQDLVNKDPVIVKETDENSSIKRAEEEVEEEKRDEAIDKITDDNTFSSREDIASYTRPTIEKSTTVEVESENTPEVSDDIKITTVRDSDVNNVEYYIDESDDSEDTYLGTAERATERDSGEWNLTVNQKERIPDGDHEVYAKVETKESDYESERVRLRIESNYQEQKNDLKENFGSLDPDLDYDQDGISNSEEQRLGTDPYLADTDNDGYVDGDEIRNGFDPLKASAGNKSDKISLETPKDKGTINQNYEVNTAELKNTPNGKRAVFKGKALPNSFVRIYIYSDKPIIVTVRTDSNGDWLYELDKELEDGNHEIYVAVTDNTGKITSKSNPLSFIKTAEAITTNAKSSAPTTESPVDNSGLDNIFYIILIIISTFIIATVIIKTLMTFKK